MAKEMILGTVGGLGLFLFGMGLMSGGTEKVGAGKKTFLVCLRRF